MSDKIKNTTDAQFANDVKSGIVLVDFWAPWCGPCRAQGPILEALAEDIGDTVAILKLNVDENPATAAKFGVRSIPTLILLKDGSVNEQFVGLQRKEQLATAIGVLAGK